MKWYVLVNFFSINLRFDKSNNNEKIDMYDLLRTSDYLVYFLRYFYEILIAFFFFMEIKAFHIFRKSKAKFEFWIKKWI